MPATAGAAFRSALAALGEADCSDPRAPRLTLPRWTDARPEGEAAWIQVADAGDVEYAATLNGQGPFRMVLGKSHDQGLWQLETVGAALRVPAPAGGAMSVSVRATAADKTQTLVAGSYDAPEALAFLGATGHLVVCSEDEAGATDAHLFLHVLNIQDRGLTAVRLAVWCKIESE